MIKYELSNKQLIAISDGQGLRIAIPQTSDCPHDDESLRRWYLNALPDLVPNYVTDVRRCHVWAHLLARGNASIGNLESYLGGIVDSDNCERHPCFSLRVIIGNVLNTSAATDTKFRLTRWPGGMVIYAKSQQIASVD